MDSLNPSPPATESEPDDEIEVDDAVEPEIETVHVSIYEVGLCARETTHALVKKKGKAKDKFYGKLILNLDNEVRSSVEQGTAAIEKLVEKLGNVKDKVECRKLKKELEEARLSNTFLRMQNERVERDLYWTRVRAREFYQEMIRRGFVLEERPNEAINVPIEDDKSPSIMPPKSTPMTQAAICRMIKESVEVAIVAEGARKENVRNNASGSGPVRGAVELRRWFEKTESVFEISECVEDEAINDYRILSDRRSSKNGARIVKPKRVKVDAYIRGLMDNINDEVTSSKPANLNKAIHMAHKLMDQKLQASDARILEGKKRKWKSYQSGNSSGNTQAIVTAPTDGKLPLCERCFNRHVGQCTIKCHKCGKVGYKAREQGHSMKRCPKKVKQEEVGEVRG
ncbi:hypothetical protein Tco_0640315 [Tanacetum coccineum]